MLPVPEPKVLAHTAHFYALKASPSLEQFTAIAEAWRPFRTWATVLIRLAGDRAGEITLSPPHGAKGSTDVSPEA